MATPDQPKVIETSQQYNDAGEQILNLATQICSGNLDPQEEELKNQMIDLTNGIMVKQDNDVRPR